MNKSISYREIYAKAVAAMQTPEGKKEILDLLRDWRKEYLTKL